MCLVICRVIVIKNSHTSNQLLVLITCFESQMSEYTTYLYEIVPHIIIVMALVAIGFVHASVWLFSVHTLN